MDNQFWCITVQFNPAGYKSRLENYDIFADRLSKQKINLLTVELTFHNQSPVLTGNNVLHLHGNSILWQKERLINYAISSLPSECTNFAWLDADLLLPDGWNEMVMKKLEKNDFVQVFAQIAHLAPGVRLFGGHRIDTKYGIVWQKKTYGENWIPYRLKRAIYHTEPGFGWASKRTALRGGLYDRLIVGGGDNWLADCLLDSYQLHHYLGKITEHQKQDMEEWKSHFLRNTNRSVDYLPVEIYHLWHGDSKNRAYHTRDLIFRMYDYDPRKDLKLENHVWEWASNKPKFHQSIIDYFRSRKEDGERE